MQIELATITPHMAKTIMLKNNYNRKIKQYQVDCLTRDILAGNWKENGDAIRVMKDGTLLDGQHRLMACITANMPIKSILVTDLNDDVMPTIDSGVKRTYNDHLHLRGISYSNQVASAIGHVIGMAYNLPSRHKVTTFAEKNSLFDAHPKLVESAAFCHQSFPKIQSLLTAIHYVGVFTGHKETANDFINVWKNGEKTYANDAAKFAREYLIKSYSVNNGLNAIFKTRLIVQSWNKFLLNEPMFQARVPDVYGIKGWNIKSLGF